MGHRRVPTIHTLDKIAGEEGLIVRLKGLRIGKLRKLIRIMESDEQGLSDMLDELTETMAAAAISWNLEDEDGNPVEFDRDGIEELELDQLMGIVNAWTGAMTSVDDELGKDSTSGERFPVPPLTMEAL
jgi:hypothetical protein